jgi:Fe-S-cluster containining protein
MVAGCETIGQIAQEVAEVYEWLSTQIRRSGELAGACKACGKCCDFDRFDHRLFVATPELIYLVAKLGPEPVKPMTNGRCPYQKNDKCTIHEDRFAGCRIFCCAGDEDYQGRLSEAALKKFKWICTQSGLAYRYADLGTTLNSFERD